MTEKKMNIKLIRQHFSDSCTIGTLKLDDFYCYTLEDKDRHLSQTDSLETIRSIKVYGKTAIPYGTYELAVTFSNKFQKFMPLLLDVKGFDGIRIHTGNTEVDSLGCILVGQEKDILNSVILKSRAAYAELMLLINEKVKTEKIYLTIERQIE